MVKILQLRHSCRPHSIRRNSKQFAGIQRCSSSHFVFLVSEVYLVVDIESLAVQNFMAFRDMKMTGSVLSGDLNAVKDDLQGTVYFEKRLSATNALRSNQSSTGRRHGQLAMPRWFILEHGNKFRRAVELRSDLSCNKPWPYRLSFCTSREVPEVSFQGKRWADFVASHGLIKGDHLVFSLTAMSQFQVYVFNAAGDPKGSQTIHTPLKCFEAIKRRDKKLAYRKSVDKINEPANKVKIEDDEIPGSPSNDTTCEDSSMKNTPLPLGFLSRSVPCLPSFSKRLAAINVQRLEIPKDFVAAFRRKLHDPVQLQGIHEDSPVQNNVRCVCYTAHGVDRLFLRGVGWDGFLSKNELCFGEELVFTLTSDSCFVVKKEISWNPRTGMQLGSSTLMSARKLGAQLEHSSTSTGCDQEEEPIEAALRDQ